ncbi:hypothetical protein KCK34_002826 [Clostridium perfringens]|nr:hypothetical protein [Clostridium perfringens]ELC8414512.1 hypothetical protein [Clostridium perfringens]MDM0461705.1 hypothetical protein [Clostridium perfringens]MDU6636125.1 hypothetical protein [Clostridium perfringens]HAT4181344.1 hypothetical protein [Clostridium perfringens]
MFLQNLKEDKISNDNKSKTDNKSKFDIYKQIFDEYQSDKVKNEDIKKLYVYIKNKYIKKLKKGELDLRIERIRIEEELNKSNSKYTDKDEKLRVMIGTLYLTVTINLVLEFLKTNFDSKYSFGLGLLFVVYILYKIDKIIRKNKNKEKDLVNKISLKVLDDIINGEV